MQATVLVHEVYLRLADVRLPASFAGRKHFFAAAAEAMRRILIERARRKMGPTRGGRRKRVDLDGAWELAEESATFDVLALDEALERLALAAPAKAELVKLRFFAGLSMSDAADLLGISLATAERHWVFARTWLYAELQEEDGGPSKKKSEGP